MVARSSHLFTLSRTITLTLKPKQTSFNASVKLGLGACITELRPGPLMDTREVSVDDRILRYPTLSIYLSLSCFKLCLP